MIVAVSSPFVNRRQRTWSATEGGRSSSVFGFRVIDPAAHFVAAASASKYTSVDIRHSRGPCERRAF